MEIRGVDWSNPADTRAVLDLNIELQREGYTRHGLPMAPEHEELLRAKLIADLSSLPEIVAFLAWEGEEAVAILLCRRGYSTYAVRRTIYCEDLWVKHAFRRRGVARALIQHVIEHARSQEYARVELTTTTNNRAAGALYQSFEFSCSSPISDGRLAEALETMQLDPAEYAVVMKRQVI